MQFKTIYSVVWYIFIGCKCSFSTRSIYNRWRCTWYE